MKRIQLVKRVPRRAPIDEAYALPEMGRFFNVGLIHATLGVDVDAIQDGPWKRLIEHTKKRS